MAPARVERTGPSGAGSSLPAPRPDLGQRLVCGAVFLLPLACWPGPGSAFSTPKILLLAFLDLALVAIALSGRRGRPGSPAAEWLALGWVAAVSISSFSAQAMTFEALVLALLPVPIFWAAGRGLIPGDSVARAIWLGTMCEAAIVVLQFGGLDPLRWLAWQPEGFANPRMRVYGTMGNPNFVAAWCCATLPFCWREVARDGLSRRSRALRWAAAALQIAAILCTGSRVFALVIPLQAAIQAVRSRRMRWAWLLALPAASALLFLSPARPLAATIQGRLYLARVTVSHWRTPPAGYGPGSFEGQFGLWQAEWLKSRPDPGSARFAGVVDHAHNDYLEFLVEHGPAALAVFLGLCGWMAAQAWRGRAQPVWSVESAASIGAASLLAIAAVDFPFHRPAEWSLFWLLLGILAAQRNPNTQGA